MTAIFGDIHKDVFYGTFTHGGVLYYMRGFSPKIATGNTTAVKMFVSDDKNANDAALAHIIDSGAIPSLSDIEALYVGNSAVLRGRQSKVQALYLVGTEFELMTFNDEFEIVDPDITMDGDESQSHPGADGDGGNPPARSAKRTRDQSDEDDGLGVDPEEVLGRRRLTWVVDNPETAPKVLMRHHSALLPVGGDNKVVPVTLVYGPQSGSEDAELKTLVIEVRRYSLVNGLATVGAILGTNKNPRSTGTNDAFKPAIGKCKTPKLRQEARNAYLAYCAAGKDGEIAHAASSGITTFHAKSRYKFKTFISEGPVSYSTTLNYFERVRLLNVLALLHNVDAPEPCSSELIGKASVINHGPRIINLGNIMKKLPECVQLYMASSSNPDLVKEMSTRVTDFIASMPDLNPYKIKVTAVYGPNFGEWLFHNNRTSDGTNDSDKRFGEIVKARRAEGWKTASYNVLQTRSPKFSVKTGLSDTDRINQGYLCVSSTKDNKTINTYFNGALAKFIRSESSKLLRSLICSYAVDSYGQVRSFASHQHASGIVCPRGVVIPGAGINSDEDLKYVRDLKKKGRSLYTKLTEDALATVGKTNVIPSPFVVEGAVSRADDLRTYFTEFRNLLAQAREPLESLVAFIIENPKDSESAEFTALATTVETVQAVYAVVRGFTLFMNKVGNQPTRILVAFNIHPEELYPYTDWEKKILYACSMVHNRVSGVKGLPRTMFINSQKGTISDVFRDLTEKEIAHLVQLHAEMTRQAQS